MADDFFDKHKDVFLSEAKALIDKMNFSLLGLERNPDDDTLFHEVFRSAHTLKGISATMNYSQISQLCHAIEDVLEALRNKKSSLDKASDPLFSCFDALSSGVKSIADNGQEENFQDLIQHISLFLKGDKETLENEFDPVKKYFQTLDQLKNIEVKVDRLDTLMKISEELLISRIKLELLRETINNPELTAAVDTLGRHITNMQYNIMQIRLVPISFIFNRFPRMVRDLAKQQGKEVDLIVDSGDIELDRSLVDELGESLTHLIRNAIDHGIEDPHVRAEKQKNKTAVIRLTARRTKEYALIEVSDDGEGLNLEAIEKTALKQGMITAGASRSDVLNSIFHGLSTTKNVSDVSGRGLGLPIVKQQIDAMGGSIQVESRSGEGTRFLLKIPLTLAVIHVLFVSVGGQIYAIPINSIDRLLTVTSSEIKGMLNYNAIPYGDGNIPLVHLSELFKTPPTIMENYPIVVIYRNDERLGLIVENLHTTQEVVIKPLSQVVRENKYFSGSALVGSGEMVLILDVEHLFLTRRHHDEWGTITAV